ncbi:hypothetical protein ACFYUY_04360 [Kitasatospora sp. NPDC004745]|uniref:hypothetical protein n=1 Tax=Kitasatospora sp. NPDC004745 TaxID=3364019 RepID=UPI0036C58FCF
MNFFADPAVIEAGLKLIGLCAAAADLAAQALRRRTLAAAQARKALRPRGTVTRKSARRLVELRRLRQRRTKAAARPTSRRSAARRVSPARRRP